MPCSNPTPDVSSKYGAPMGRHTGPNYLETCAGKLYLRRVRINSGGYDDGGAYWGIGQPLFHVEDPDGNSQFMRAHNRAAAKTKILADWPGATFYR